ncbi:Ig-like domain-containing protein, partial [Sphingobium bisphenolivorans]|uniref:Ig-like domain-containing protein n=1 Tax=Sphingobium bisphenolivorans TaxID=1335760 RepID=UPI00056BBB0B
IVDDQPQAANDSGYVAPEDTTITIDALLNDQFGADGVDIHDGTKVTIISAPQHGSASYDPVTGLFSYTPNAVAVATPDSFTYQIVDGDGDPSIATVSILLQPDATPSILLAQSVTVDEDGLTGANVDAGRTGEVASTGSASATGQIVVDFFKDVPAQADALASIKLVDSGALDGQLKTLAGANVTFALDGAGDLVGSSAGGEVIRIHIVSATVGTGVDATKVTYSYSVTLSQPVQHSVAGSEDSDLLSGIGFEVTDTDNSKTAGSFSVTVVDDLPALTVSDTPTSVVEGGTANGNWALTAGADGVSAVTVTFG